MKSVNISLDTIEKVKNFVTVVSNCPYDMDLTSGRYTIDAKSIMGIFSLDLSSPIQLDIQSDDDASAVLKELAPFIVK